MSRKKKNVLNGVQVQGLRLKEDDILIVKHPVDEDGRPIYNFKNMKAFHDSITRVVDCKVLSVPGNIEFIKVKKDSDEHKTIIENMEGK